MESRSFRPESLTDFCREVIARHGEKNWPPAEENLGEEFVKFFGLGPFTARPELEKLARLLGIEISRASLPEELPGCHFSYGGKRSILVSDNPAYVLTDEHTIFHELREMIEYTFRDLGHPILTETSQEIRAEEFATAVTFTASMPVWGFLLDRAITIESKWRKIGAFALVGIGMILYGFVRAMLPALEDFSLNRQRQEAWSKTGLANRATTSIPKYPHTSSAKLAPPNKLAKTECPNSAPPISARG